MARRGRSNQRVRKRDDFSIARRFPLLSVVLPRLPHRLSVYGDRREFHPLRLFRSPSVVGSRSARRLVVDKDRPFKFGDVLKFAVPRRVLICIRRKERREVLHAKRFTGRGSGGGAKRRNMWSMIKC